MLGGEQPWASALLKVVEASGNHAGLEALERHSLRPGACTGQAGHHQQPAAPPCALGLQQSPATHG